MSMVKLAKLLDGRTGETNILDHVGDFVEIRGDIAGHGYSGFDSTPNQSRCLWIRADECFDSTRKLLRCGQEST